MSASPRPPPSVLFVHDGQPYDSHVQHLKDAGLRVSETHATSAVATATQLQPDIIVLDFGCDGEITQRLKGDADTLHIPVIALVESLPCQSFRGRAALGRPALPFRARP